MREIPYLEYGYKIRLLRLLVLKCLQCFLIPHNTIKSHTNIKYWSIVAIREKTINLTGAELGFGFSSGIFKLHKFGKN